MYNLSDGLWTSDCYITLLKNKNTYQVCPILSWQVVAPKKARLAEAETSLAETMEILNAKRQELNEVEAKLANLKLSFAEMTEKKQQLEFQVWQCFYCYWFEILLSNPLHM